MPKSIDFRDKPDASFPTPRGAQVTRSLPIATDSVPQRAINEEPEHKPDGK